MKLIFKFFFLLFFVAINAQENSNNTKMDSNSLNMKSGLTSPIIYDGIFESLNPSVISSISEIKFENRNLLHLLSDKNNHYNLFNLSILEDSFEKIYFIKGIVKLNFFIQTEHGLHSNLAWIISDNKNDNTTTCSQIEILITETKSVSNNMSKSEKENWLLNKLN